MEITFAILLIATTLGFATLGWAFKVVFFPLFGGCTALFVGLDMATSGLAQRYVVNDTLVTEITSNQFTFGVGMLFVTLAIFLFAIAFIADRFMR